MTRIAITGGPRTGKTTMAKRLVGDSSIADWGTPGACFGGPTRAEQFVRHTDDLIHLGWSGASQAACGWFDEPGPWIIEGVAVSRALRKWRDQHPGEPPPVDRVIYLAEPHETLVYGQRVMASGVRTVHDEIELWLRQHGILTERPIAPQVRASSYAGPP